MEAANTGKQVTMVVGAFALSDQGDGPTYAFVTANEAWLSSLSKMVEACAELGLSQVRREEVPEWGPEGIEEWLMPHFGELVVKADGSLGYTAVPKNQSYLIETRLVALSAMEAAFETAESGSVVYLGEDADELRRLYVTDHQEDLPKIEVGKHYEFYAEMQEAELPPAERMRNYTGQQVLVVSGPQPKDDPDDSDCFVVRASDGREFEAMEEELNGWDKALGQYFWRDGTYGPNRSTTFLVNERKAA